MNEIKLAIEIEHFYEEKVEAMAQQERRSVRDEAAYLMEKGLLILEQQQTQIEGEKCL
jgi:hypothetical protein